MPLASPAPRASDGPPSPEPRGNPSDFQCEPSFFAVLGKESSPRLATANNLANLLAGAGTDTGRRCGDATVIGRRGREGEARSKTLGRSALDTRTAPLPCANHSLPATANQKTTEQLGGFGRHTP